MQGKRITPKPGKVYRNKGGGEFLCLESFDGSAVMQNTASRWTFEAHGITQYEDGTLEWDYSNGEPEAKELIEDEVADIGGMPDVMNKIMDWSDS